MLLRKLINREDREHYIKVNNLFAKCIIFYAKKYPEPTRENCRHPNSHRLIDLRDDFRDNWEFSGRQELFLALFKIVIDKYEHSPNWRYVLDRVIMLIMKSGWKPWNPNRQMPCFKGDRNA